MGFKLFFISRCRLSSNRRENAAIVFLHNGTASSPASASEEIIMKECREYWMIYTGPGFSRRCMIWPLHHPHPLPPLPSEGCLFFSVFLCVAGQAYWRERWWGKSQIIRPRGSLILLIIIEYSLGEGQQLMKCEGLERKIGQLYTGRCDYPRI